MRVPILALGAGLMALVTSCTPPAHEPHAESAPVEATNRIPIPPEVVSNIGITFVRAERGRLAEWLRVPGSLDLPPDRRSVVRSPARGRVRLEVRIGDVVEDGVVLAIVDTPELRKAQDLVLAASTAADLVAERIAAASQRLEESEALGIEARRVEREVERRRDRLRTVASAATDGSTFSNRELLEVEEALLEARARTLSVLSQRDDLKRQTRQLEVDLLRARIELDERYVALSVLTGHPPDALASSSDAGPLWRTIDRVELRSPRAGIVTSVDVTSGEHVAEGAALVAVTDPSTLLFRGFVPESDRTRVSPAASVRLDGPGLAESIETTLWSSPPSYDPATRRIELSAWVPNPGLKLPPGLSATGLVRVAEGKSEEVLLDRECVVFDGLDAVVFRRDPADPDSVVRTSVELGRRSGGMVEVLAGVLEGDEVVLDGAHQLKQTGLGKAPEGGHFHADGTYHEGH